MRIKIDQFEVDLGKKIDLTLPIRRAKNVNAYYLPEPKFQTFEVEGFIGDVNRGGSCNVEVLNLHPHANGTHTECVGHISKEKVYVSQVLQDKNFFYAGLYTLLPENGVITKKQFLAKFPTWDKKISALIIRTLPNDAKKRSRVYSGQNPPYVAADLMAYFHEMGIVHFLIDLPSVDKEDDPKLLGHHAFFHYPESLSLKKTITELIYIPESVKDGRYLLNIQTPQIETNAVPSSITLYELEGA